MFVDFKKSAFDLTTSFNKHTSMKSTTYTGEETTKSDKKAFITKWTNGEISLVVATCITSLQFLASTASLNSITNLIHDCKTDLTILAIISTL